MGNGKLDILAFGAHPDDAELGCGGTLLKLAQQGLKTGIIDLTEGEMGTRGTVEERYKESGDAAAILQVQIRSNLKIPDAQIEQTEQNRLKVIQAIRKHQPQLVFAPYPDDRHPDHIHASQLVREACFYAGVKRVAPSDIPAYRPRKIVYYMMTYEFTPSFVVDISEQFSRKIDAIGAHRSQFYNPGYKGEPTFISSKDYFDSLDFRARHYGWMAGVTYGEPFWIKELIAIDNIFTILTNARM